MLYLYTKNRELINFGHVFFTTIVFSLLSLLFYFVFFRI
jgi:hypothetical protein